VPHLRYNLFAFISCIVHVFNLDCNSFNWTCQFSAYKATGGRLDSIQIKFDFNLLIIKLQASRKIKRIKQRNAGRVCEDRPYTVGGK
jgi:hypothetical protein